MINIDEAQTSALLLASVLREHLMSPSILSGMTNSHLFSLNEVEWRKNVLEIYKASVPLFLEFLTSPQSDMALETRTQATRDALSHTFQLDPYVLDGLKKSQLWQQWVAPFVQQKIKSKEKMEKEYQESVRLFKEDYEVIDGNFDFDFILQNISEFEEYEYDFGSLHLEITDELQELQGLHHNIRQVENEIRAQNLYPMIKQLNEQERGSFLKDLFMDHLKAVVFQESFEILECLGKTPTLAKTQTPEIEFTPAKPASRKLG